MNAVAKKIQEREKALTEAKELLNKAEKEERDLSQKEKKEYNRLKTKAENLNREIREKKLEFEGKGEEARMETAEIKENKEIYRKEDIDAFARDIKQNSEVRSELPAGTTTRDLSCGRAIKSIITGDWTGAEAEKRAMSTTPNASGGYVVPDILSADVIGAALNKTAVLSAGAAFTEMESKKVTIPRVTEIPEAEWKGENNEISDYSSMTFEGVDLEAKTLMSIVDLSIELAEDGQNIEQTIENALSDALALKMDYAALKGTGSDNEPLGVANQPNIQTIEHNAILDNYSVFSRAAQKVREENGEPQAVILAPRSMGELDRLTADDGQPLQPPQSWQDLEKYSTNQVPTDLGTDEDETEAFVADWSKLLWGIRTSLTVEVSREAGEAFKKGQVHIRAYLRGDVALAQPPHFVQIEGIEETTA